MAKNKKETTEPLKAGEFQVNFGNVEALKMKFLNSIAGTLLRIEELLKDGRSK